MSPLTLRHAVGRSRRLLLTLSVVAALGGVLALHHAMPSMAMDGHHGMSDATLMEICVGVLAAGAAVVVAVASLLGVRPPWRIPLPAVRPAGNVARPAGRSSARAGPIFLCVIRR